MALGRLNPGSPQYYQASGEATPQARLPEQFVSNPPADSPLYGHLQDVYVSYHDIRKAPIVSRVPDMTGYRTLYARGMSRMPIQRLGADGTPVPWTSRFQPDNEGPIRNGRFNDALFRAGYPGYNLGLSFKVPTLESQSSQMRPSATYAPANINVSQRIPLMRKYRGIGQGNG